MFPLHAKQDETSKQRGRVTNPFPRKSLGLGVLIKKLINNFMESSTKEIITQIFFGILPIIGTVIGLFVGYLVARKRYAFEKIYEQKLICLKELYKQIVNLEFMIKKHINSNDNLEKTANEKMESLNKFKSSFEEFQYKFREMEIMLEEDNVDEIEKLVDVYNKIIPRLTASIFQGQVDKDYQSDENWKSSFELIYSDLVKAKINLKKEFRKTLGIKS